MGNILQLCKTKHSNGLDYIRDWSLQRSWIHGSPHLDRALIHNGIFVWLTRWTDSSLRVLTGPCNENLGADRVEIRLYLSQKSKHKLPFTAYRCHDLTAPCLPLFPSLCLSSFQLLHFLALLALMVVRPFHESTQFTKPAEFRKTTATFSLGQRVTWALSKLWWVKLARKASWSMKARE